MEKLKDKKFLMPEQVKAGSVGDKHDTGWIYKTYVTTNSDTTLLRESPGNSTGTVTINA